MHQKVHVQANINGQDVEFLCEPRQSLLEVLRDVLWLKPSGEEMGERDWFTHYVRSLGMLLRCAAPERRRGTCILSF